MGNRKANHRFLPSQNDLQQIFVQQIVQQIFVQQIFAADFC